MLPQFALRTLEPTSFGSGWVSGVLSATLGLIGLGAVLCFRFPDLLTTPEARAWYPLPWVRALLHLALVGAFVLGVASLWLRRNKALGTVGVACTLAAALLGGSGVPVGSGASEGPFLGLDWFLLNLIVYSLVFLPIERLFARLPEQGVFRAGWRTDLTYFFVSALLVLVTTGPLRRLVATPQFHHWHHASDAEGVDKNFAVHLPVLDFVFGTAYLPDRWPSGYGINGGATPPNGYLSQLLWPFGKSEVKSEK